MKNRNYGLYLGDRVTTDSFNQQNEVATVVSFDGLDNNRCTIEDQEGSRRSYVCEWLTRIPPVGYLDFYPVDGVKYIVMTEYTDQDYPELSYVLGEYLYETVARMIYNSKRLFSDTDRLKRILIYVQESECDLRQVLYQVIKEAQSFDKAIKEYDERMKERLKLNEETSTEEE